jgi:flagellar basal-body rod protein FlgB
MSGMETRMIELASRALDLAARRHAMVSSNLANIDTPGYRTRDVDFARELRRAAQGFPAAEPRVREVRGLIERPDGNNVSLEREGLSLADVQLRYRLSVQLLRVEFRRLLAAIQEGR